MNDNLASVTCHSILEIGVQVLFKLVARLELDKQRLLQGDVSIALLLAR
jgi:hypothetical protein